MSIATSLLERRCPCRRAADHLGTDRPTFADRLKSGFVSEANDRPETREETAEDPYIEQAIAVATERIWAAFVLAEAKRRADMEPKHEPGRNASALPRVSIEHVRLVIADYAPHPALIDREIQELRRVLGNRATEFLGPRKVAIEGELAASRDLAVC